MTAVTTAATLAGRGGVEVDFGDGGSARWAELSDEAIDLICAFIESIRPPDTVT
ncbi:hypothetical protein MycrhDRAFT_5504 [Mycolicibacterium rhodesiae JS60]|nr:hypothetical protein MycrhDRAFT_5504 [Mycolicibacterium rhodesiae JS60]